MQNRREGLCRRQARRRGYLPCHCGRQRGITIPTRIDRTAVVNSDAIIGSNVEIGPFSVIDGNVIVGDDCWIGNHVSLLAGTQIGKECRIFHNAVIGEIPQDLKFRGEETTVEIGDRVVIRESVTVNRGTSASGRTVVGGDSLLMAYVHVAHDCEIGDNVIIANAVQMGGHVLIDDWASIGGVVAIHQFCRIGKHAFIAGGFRAVQDVPPYVIAAGEPLRFSGINSVGLRRHGLNQESRNLIKRAYRVIYRSSLNTRAAVEKIKKELPQTAEIQEIIAFVEKSERGLI